MSPDDTMDHRTRRVVYNYISTNPGVTFGTLRRVYDLSESTLRYHLRYLERRDRIHSKITGKNRCYYSKQAGKPFPGPLGELDPDRLTRVQQRLLHIIRKNPGISMGELTRRTDLDRGTVRTSIRELRDMMVVWKVGNGRGTGYEYITRDRLKGELLKLLIKKFLKKQIDEKTYRSLKRQLEE